MHKTIRRISRRGIGYNENDSVGKFELFYEKCGTLKFWRVIK